MDESESQIDVEFQFDEIKESDFHGIKSLLKQTFSTDEDKVDTSCISDYIIRNSRIGTCVKCDSDDPFAIMTFINLNDQEKCIQTVSKYLASKIKSKQVCELLPRCGWIFSERLINMPAEIAPPLLRLLLDELQKTQFKCDYFLFLIKVYKQCEAEVEDDETEKTIKKRKIEQGLFYFQAEDEYIEKHAIHVLDFPIPKKSSNDSRGTFFDYGIEPSRRILIVKAEKIKTILKELEELFPN